MIITTFSELALVPDESTSGYSHDTLNRISSLANSLTGSFGFSYDQLSRRTQMTRPNGVNTNYSYDSLSRLLTAIRGPLSLIPKFLTRRSRRDCKEAAPGTHATAFLSARHGLCRYHNTGSADTDLWRIRAQSLSGVGL